MELWIIQDLARHADHKPRLPVFVHIGEAMSLAAFVDRNWLPSTDGAGRPIPGLNSAKKKLSREVSAEIVQLAGVARAANDRVLMASTRNLSPEKYKRADELEAEIEAVLAFHFDDGVDDDYDAQLEALRKSPAMASESVAAKAMSLEQLYALAKPIEAELDGLGDFDISLLEEARTLAVELRAIDLPSGPQSEEAKAALQERNAALGALAVRVAAVRQAAAYIYRKHPAIARKATSAYERNRRARLLRERAKLVAEVA